MELYNSRRATRCTFGYDDALDAYTLVTNAIDCWWNSDDLSFVWEPCSLPYGECSRLELTVTVTDFKESEARASAGLVLRDALTPTAANAFLNIRRNTIFLTYRRADGEDTYAARADMPDGLSFPLSLRLVRQGYVTSGYFRGPGDSDWREVGTVEIPLRSDLYAGFGGYSYLADYPITAVFKDYKAVVTNTDFVSSEDCPPSGEDLPDGLLLRERFEDGSAVRPPVSKLNPVWSGVTQANIVETAGPDGERIRAWHKHFMPGYHFAGNVRWTDYSLEASLKFTDDCRKDGRNQVGFFVRQREMDLYGKFHYAVYLTGGDTISICKSAADSVYRREPEVSAPLSYLEIGRWNRIRIDAFDNTVTVWWNGEKVLSYEDNGTVIAPFGRIGFMTEDTSVCFTDFTVTELPDLLGGAYDNLIGGLWNEPAPEGFFYEYEPEDHNAFMSNSESATGY